MMERCKNCKHWRSKDLTSGNLNQYEGVCGSVVVNFPNAGDIARIGTLSYTDQVSGAKLITHREFGCVMWEEKPKDK